jgi:hypothetical protein
LERGTQKQEQYGADQGRIENRIEYGERGRERERERREWQLEERDESAGLLEADIRPLSLCILLLFG